MMRAQVIGVGLLLLGVSSCGERYPVTHLRSVVDQTTVAKVAPRASSTSDLAAPYSGLPAGPLSWNVFFDHVRSHSPELAAARAQARAALARVDGSGAWSDPQLTAGLAPRTVGNGDEVRYALELSQPMPWSSQQHAERAATWAEAQAAVADLEIKVRHHLVEARSMFAEYWLNTERRALYDRELALLDAQIVAADATVSGGGDSMGAAEARAMHAEVARMRLMADREIISNGTAMMRVMLGLPGDAALPPPADDLGEPDLASIPDEAELLDLSRRRPEVMAAEARLRVAEARRADAEANGLPNWEAMAGWSTMEDSLDMRFTVGVGVQIPVQRAPRQAQRIAAGEMVNAARSEVEAAMSEADRDVMVAAARLREHAAAVRLLRDEELPATQAAVDAARAAQASGKANLVDVIQAERRRLTAEQRLLFEKHEYFHWMGELECCIGMSLVDLSRPSSAINEK